jgi:hypothetical protein
VTADDAVATIREWIIVQYLGEFCIFGFAERHASTGGLSWVISTPVVDLSATAAGTLRTISGRLYILGKRIEEPDLDEEGRVALRMLIRPDGVYSHDEQLDLLWLTALKMARHLGLKAPPRAAHDAIAVFVQRHGAAYQMMRDSVRIGRPS